MGCHVYTASSSRTCATDLCAVRRTCLNARRAVSVQASTGSTTVGTRSTEGKSVEAHSLRIQRMVGQGSFGEVFEGIFLDKQETHRVIMKRVKSKTAGAEEMGENEHKLNVYVQKNASGSCAEFFGYTIVERSDRVADKRITPGKWLLWKYQGLKTLRDYLSRKDCLTALAVDLRVPEHVVIPTVIVQLFQCVQKLHGAGLVHRDVKPSNIILCEEDCTFRLIDLGAMADLRTGMNYVPGESILDPYYCPPEQYVLPTDTPDLANTNRMMSMAMSAMLWNRHKPDRFDTYSIGLIFMQLAVPQLRMKSGLQNFHKSFKTCRYDLMRWRTISNLSPQQTAVLDANNGAGWDLAAALLRPRKVQVLSDGHVYFTNEGKQRPSAEAAVQFPFLAPAFNPDLTPEELAEGTMSGSRNWLSLFSHVQNRVTNLGDEIGKTAQQAEETSTTIQKLRSKVQAGEGNELELERAEGMLSNLTGSLNYLQSEMSVALKGARRAFQQGFGEDSESEIDIPALTPSEEYELQKQIAAQEAAAASAKTPPTPVSTQWSLAGAMLSGIQSMGRAVQVSGDVVERINTETQAAMQYGKNLNSEEEKFIGMLEQGQVRASAQWPGVAEHFAADPRFTAVPELNRFVLFRSYIRMQQDMNALKLDDAEREYMRRLVQRVTTSRVSWNNIKKAWQREAFFRAVDPAAAETLFTRHVAKLQQDEAADARERAAELSYRSALESLDPAISARCNWSAIQDTVPKDRAYDHLDNARRESIFEDVKADAAAAEAQAQAAAAAEAALLRARHEQREKQEREQLERVKAGATASSNGSRSNQDAERQVLSKLRADQVRLKEEYEKMERKLKEMESRLQEGNKVGGNGDAAEADAPAEERVPAVSSNGRSLMNGRK